MAEGIGEGRLGRRARSVALGAAVGGALGEALTAALLCLEAGGSALAALAGAAAAAGLLLAALVPVAWLCAWVAGWPTSAELAHGLRTGLAGASGRASAGTLAAALALVASLLAAFAGGSVLLEGMTPPFALAGALLSCGAALALALPIAARIGRWLSPFLDRAPGDDRRQSAVALLLVVAASALVLHLVLPFAYLLSPSSAGAAAGAVMLWSRPPSARALAVTGLLSLCLAGAGLASFEILPGEARRTVRGRAVITGNLLAGVHWLADRDRDGHAPILLGGDCDDGNDAIFPGAREIPHNGIDENCSGSDAAAFRPVRQAATGELGLPERGNVVLIQIDALRPDHLGFAGYHRPTTPHLDAFRKTATWFEHAYTPGPTTRFAMASLLTGYDVRRLPHHTTRANRFRMSKRAITVAERLDGAGYDRTGYTISYVVQHNRGMGQGFTHWSPPWTVTQWRRAYRSAATKTTDALLEYLKGRDGTRRPYLLFGHYRCTHSPYLKYDEFDYGDDPIDLYDSALNYCDREIGRLLDAVQARDDYDRTAVILFSDHGELFGEHGMTGHGKTLNEPDVRVLVLARFPGASVRRVKTPVILTDVGATVLAFTGVPRPSDMDGLSLLPLAHGKGELPPRDLFMFTDLWRGAVRHRAEAVLRHPLKLIVDHTSGTSQLFDVVADPAERRDLSTRLPREHLELSDAIESYGAYVEGHPAKVSDRTKKKKKKRR